MNFCHSREGGKPSTTQALSHNKNRFPPSRERHSAVIRPLRIILITLTLIFPLPTPAATITTINDDNIQHFVHHRQDENTRLECKKIPLVNGLIKNKCNQYYKNIPIYNTLVTNSEIGGQAMHWHGQILGDIQQDIRRLIPRLDKNTLLQRLKKGRLTRNEEATLYIRKNRRNQAELVYLVSFTLEGSKPARPYYIVNAHTGQIIKTWDGLTTQRAEGPGGNEKIGSYYYGRDFPPLEVSDLCEMQTAEVETYDMQNQYQGGVLFRFQCPTNTYHPVNGAYSPLNDAHYFGSIVFKMYQEWYAMKPLETKLRLRIHYGRHHENASWDGEYFSFGDGGKHVYPLVSLDIMAHEISHAVTEKNAHLEFFGQAGAISEAFSDMAGECAKYFMNQAIGKENDWLAAGSILKGPLGRAIRYFKNPPEDGVSIDNAKDYREFMNVHHASGIFNKAFYLLANKANWGIKKAFTVFLTANRVYWVTDTNFDDAACGVVKAAGDLQYEKADVIASFEAVGVNCKRQ